MSLKLIELGIEIWYAGRCVWPIGSKTTVATTNQLTIAIANYVTVTELVGTRGQLALKMVIKQQKLMLKTSMEVLLQL